MLSDQERYEGLFPSLTHEIACHISVNGLILPYSYSFAMQDMTATLKKSRKRRGA